MLTPSTQQARRPSTTIRLAALAGLVVGIPTLIAAVVGVIMGRLETSTDVIPSVLVVTTTLVMMTLFAILRSAKIRRRRRFQMRELLTEDEWYDRFYSSTWFPRPVVMSILSAFAAEVGGNVSPTQLRPDDRLEDFVLTFWGVPTDDSFETVECELATLLGHDFVREHSWRTLDDVIVGVCQQACATSSQPTSHVR